MGLALLALTGPALGEGMPRRVHLTLPACAPEPFAYDALEAALGLELTHAGVGELVRGAPPVVGAGEAHLVLLFPCSPTAPTATLVVRASGGELVRSLDLSDLDAPVRPRAIALQVAELLPSVWPELIAGAVPDEPSDVDPPANDSALRSAAAFEPEPAVSEPAIDTPETDATGEPSPETPADAETDAPRPDSTQELSTGSEASRRWAIGAAAQTRVFLLRSTVLFGARPVFSWGRIDAGFDLLFGSHTDPVGRLHSRLLAGSLALRVLEPEWGVWRGTLAPRLSLGTIVVRAESPSLEITTGHVREVYADVAVSAGVARAVRSCAVGPELEAGFARGFIAKHDDDPVATFGGPLVSARVSVHCSVP